MVYLSREEWCICTFIYIFSIKSIHKYLLDKIYQSYITTKNQKANFGSQCKLFTVDKLKSLLYKKKLKIIQPIKYYEVRQLIIQFMKIQNTKVEDFSNTWQN